MELLLLRVHPMLVLLVRRLPVHLLPVDVAGDALKVFLHLLYYRCSVLLFALDGLLHLSGKDILQELGVLLPQVVSFALGLAKAFLQSCRQRVVQKLETERVDRRGQSANICL